MCDNGPVRLWPCHPCASRDTAVTIMDLHYLTLSRVSSHGQLATYSCWVSTGFATNMCPIFMNDSLIKGVSSVLYMVLIHCYCFTVYCAQYCLYYGTGSPGLFLSSIFRFSVVDPTPTSASKKDKSSPPHIKQGDPHVASGLLLSSSTVFRYIFYACSWPPLPAPSHPEQQQLTDLHPLHSTHPSQLSQATALQKEILHRFHLCQLTHPAPRIPTTNLLIIEPRILADHILLQPGSKICSIDVTITTQIFIDALGIYKI